ncbi:hypothetical protein L7F22_018743 [Adiantum nelumboides]|nr:hypothetical protein [Adiantum nelumboides]
MARPRAEQTFEEEEVYNILPLHDMLADNDALRFPEVRAAMQALQSTGELRMPPQERDEWRWRQGMDLLDWMGDFFGFQKDNVKNQREHVVLLLANYQMCLQPPPEPIDVLDSRVVQHLRRRLLKNYTKWCSFLMVHNNLFLPKLGDGRRELLYCCLYLLIWGEAANLRFMPECLCFIFHHMARELNDIIEEKVDHRSGRPSLPQSFGRNGFLAKVVKPIYEAVKGEAQAAMEGRAPHSAWRNYDDMNEYFWSRRCFKQLGWPLNKSSNYLFTPQQQKGKGLNQQRQKVGKTGFVEQRSFLNIYRSFDHLWTGLILMLQAMMILAFNKDGIPWHVLYDRDVQGSLLTIFVTWSGLRVLQAVLDAATQHSLISSETKLVGLRMVLKILVASGWTAIFSLLLARVWLQRTVDRRWSPETNLRLFQFLETAAVYVLPEILAILLFILPWIRNCVERSEWRIFHAITWWFQSRLFVARGLRENVTDNIRYTVFWLVVLCAKFSFSYFLQVRPLVEPTRDLLHLDVVNFEWHEFFRNHNRFVVAVVWAPVILIYLMDIQIWYAVFQSLVGAMLGLSAHIGEIRTVQQLKLRFPFFASAITFNLAPQECLLGENALPHFRYVNLVKDMVRRVKLRYGLGKDYRKFESNTLEARKFAYIWNKVIHFFREEDLISDHELELLEIPASPWIVSVIQWPSVLLSNEVLAALSITQDWHGNDDQRLWARICKNEYRRCAVVECYETVKHLLKRILDERSKEYGIVDYIFTEIEKEIGEGTFCQRFKVSALAEVHSRVLGLVTVLLEKAPRREVVVALQNLYDAVMRDLFHAKSEVESLRHAGLGIGCDELLFVGAVQVPHYEKDKAFYCRLRRLSTTLSTKEAMNNVPRNLDARRRIAFFSNSIFMNMPHAPSVERMLSFSVLTPYYIEDVLYSANQLNSPNEDGVTILFYLQSIYPDEWNNFLERMHLQDFRQPEKELLKSEETAIQLRLWASHRGQTLGRTVRGMMYYHHALETLAYLDAASEMNLQQDQYSFRLESLNSRQSFDYSTSRRTMSNMSGINALYRASQEKATALLKFTYVVACQIYGNQKARRDPRADDILYLMRNHPAMRVAYVDEVKTEHGKKFYSVLVKYDTMREQEVEIYRIELPGHVKLGEGKPENQNHALIFTRGDAVQTIDMNQDNYFEEALKIRNLLQEFTKYYGLRRPQILGVREHVFTGSVSSLAWFMSAQESSFVTLGQRVLANPLKIRMHYGHPDVFDRIWFLTRGGISKASRVINISEDIFAGFNCTLRGGNVTHHEYIQVGKGRDLGLNQIALFEGKVSSGNGEQMLSRDVYRLGHRLDFFRMLSFYYTTVGFYVSSLITVLTVYAFLWGRVYLGLSGLEKFIASTLSNSALTASLNQQFVVQLGVFTALPMVVESSLERGFSTALWEFLTMQLEMSSVFFTFSLGTKGHYFGKTLLHGGAKYRATGRGFVVRHEKFAENYRLFARSHFVKGIELMILLIIYEAYGGLAKNTTVYIMLTLSSWFLALSWVMAPFLFNPSGFDWLQTVYDFEDFQNWLWFRGGVLTKANQSWEVWWNEEQDHLRTTGFWGKVMEVLLSLRFFLIQYGMVYRLHIAANNKSIFIYFFSWIYIIAAIFVCILIARAGEKFSAKNHLLYRAIQSFLTLAIILAFVLLLELTNFQFVDLFLSLLAFVPSGWGLLCISLVFKPLLVNSSVWTVVVTIARLYEFAMGIVVMIPLAVLSWLPGFQEMQTRMLFNQAFSRGLHISRILSGKRPNQGF